MTKLSDKMLATLVDIHCEGTSHVGAAYPEDWTWIANNRRTLIALWNRGLVSFDIVAFLSPAGKKAIEHDRRTSGGIIPKCTENNPCCNKRNVYNGFGSDGPTSFTCPMGCMCHD